MKKLIFFVILALLFIGVVGSITYLIFKHEDELIFSSQDTTELDLVLPPRIDLNESDSLWIDKFLKMGTQNYAPAAETFSMSFNVDTSILRPKSKYYQLIIDKNDIYSMFCLKQTLNSVNVRYSLTRTSEITDIFLETDRQELVQDIVKKLKIYDINAKFEELWL